MVKLPDPFQQPGREVGERGSTRRDERSHQRAHYGRRREEKRTRGQPTTLREIEEVTRRSMEEMTKRKISVENYDLVMDRVRLQYNLNVMILCEKCGTPHANDEMSAPER